MCFCVTDGRRLSAGGSEGLGFRVLLMLVSPQSLLNTARIHGPLADGSQTALISLDSSAECHSTGSRSPAGGYL